jgi:hypothetical protein
MIKGGITICHLCGKAIDEGEISREHVPPKSFYPLKVRQGLNLETVPAHKSCNKSYRKDEEYFQHGLYAQVLNVKSKISSSLTADYKRRATQPQTPAMFRRILKETSNVTPGGILLPSGKYAISLDKMRIQNVVIKILRGIYYIRYNSFLTFERIKDLRMCMDESGVPELYHLSWKVTPQQSVYESVFSYKFFSHDFFEFELCSMFFWEAVMFCLTIDKNH